jgi:cytochrome c biogenesis protein CcmG, thiol:disulfide interchange protein DsbE
MFIQKIKIYLSHTKSQSSMNAKLFILFSVSTFLSLSLLAQNTQTMPDMVLKDVNGKNKNMADYSKSGKITIVSFWATWCTPCKKELSNINELLDDWKAKYNLDLVAVTIDNSRNVPKVKPFVDGQGWTFDVIMDVNSDLARAMNVLNPPQTFLIDQSGKIIWSHVGYVEGDEYVLEEKIKGLVAKK